MDGGTCRVRFCRVPYAGPPRLSALMACAVWITLRVTIGLDTGAEITIWFLLVATYLCQVDPGASQPPAETAWPMEGIPMRSRRPCSYEQVSRSRRTRLNPPHGGCKPFFFAKAFRFAIQVLQLFEQYLSKRLVERKLREQQSQQSSRSGTRSDFLDVSCRTDLNSGFSRHCLSPATKRGTFRIPF